MDLKREKLPPKSGRFRLQRAPHTDPGQGLQFVNLTASARLDDEALDLVRRHAMLDFNRRKNEPGGNLNTKPGDPIDKDSANRQVKYSTFAESTHRFRLTGTKAGTDSKKRAPVLTASHPKQSLLGNAASKQPLAIRQFYGEASQPSGTLHEKEPAAAWPAAIDDDFKLSPLNSQLDGQPQIDAVGVVQNRDKDAEWANHQDNEVGFETSDPAHNLPALDTKRMTVLINHLRSLIVSTLLMRDIRRQWFSIAIQDPAFLFVALAHSATSLSLLEGRNDSEESLGFRTEAIRIINGRISDAIEDGQLNESTIGAVAGLASYEAIHGSLESVRTHMDGLEQMVRLTGGLRCSGFGYSIQRLILWTDLCCANAAVSYTRFSPAECISMNISLDDEAPNTLQMPLDGPSTSKKSRRVGSLQDLGLLGSRLTSAFSSLRFLSDIVNSDDFATTETWQDMKYSDKVYSIQRELLSIFKSLESSPPGLDKIVCTAGLIYIECCLRDVNPRSRMVCDLVSRLSHLMEIVSWDGIQEQIANVGMAHLLLWSIVVGGSAAMEGTADHRHFANWLAACRRKVCLKTWSDTQSVLTKVSWRVIGGQINGENFWRAS